MSFLDTLLRAFLKALAYGLMFACVLLVMASVGVFLNGNPIKAVNNIALALFGFYFARYCLRHVDTWLF